MKKRVLSLILALVFALTLVSCTSAPTEEGGEVPTPDVQEKEESEAEDLVEVWVYVRQTNPKGNVTTVTYNDFGQPEQKKQNDPYGALVGTETWEYDENGWNTRYVLTTSTYPDGQVTEYKYSNEGNLIESAAGESVKKYSYDEKGRLVEETQSLHDDRTVVSYSENNTYAAGSTVRVRKQYKRDGAVWWIETANLDANDRLVSRKTEDLDRQTVTEETFEYTYDAEERIVEQISRFADGTQNFKTVYTYTEEGLLRRRFTTYANGHTNSATYTYDENGNCTESILYNGNTESRYTWVWEKISVPTAWAEQIQQPAWAPVLP
ncbi:MAG: hypothetical protein IJF24_00560 [Clostridia bacterium]|nr:hypothetical protein [Clostridia bacterium]